ncbi:Golgi membrane exchange factor (Ric1p-Rgp1p) subunit [Sporothrix stenoceras]|uniref:Golgi membrane exchange factor (Ric1p-Rgp1p) subunit n=1 Tax=Sporothrix stenoceras TaxID=5173 RepID=A0ABR3ZMH1_9PEZI
MARDMGFGQGNGGSGPGSSSNIRVSVRWYENTIFGGDDVRCRITFSNVAPKPQPMQPQQSSSQQHHLQPASSLSSASSSRHPSNSYHPERARLPSSSSSGTLAPPAPMGRGHHRASHSISGPATGVITSVSSTSASAAAAASRRRADSIPWAPNGSAGNSNGHGSGNGNGNGNNGAGNGGSSGGHGHSHRRSLSIVSISSAGASDGPSGSPTGSPQLLNGPASSQHRPVRGHSRASSLQIGPRGSSYYGGPRSATNPPRPYSNQPSPLFNSSFPPSASDRSGNITGLRGGRLTGSATMPNTPSVGGMSRSPRSPSDGFSDFKFPMAPPPTTPSNPQGPIDGPVLASPTPMTPEDKPLPALPIRSRDGPSNNINHNNAGGAQSAQVPTIYEGPVTPSEARVLSTTSIAGTPRSSGEFYSLSNHSTETLASEYMSQQPLRSQPGRPPHTRQKSSSNLLSPPMHSQQQLSHQGHHLSRSLSQRARTSAASAAAAIAPETLMMGYAQIEGSFTLDGSLVDLSPFEQVKRKGVVGGQGGGVVGLKQNKRDSGLLRGFGWGSLATSIGDLLGGGELSTIKEMRDKASSKSVPLLATQQSVLFADLQLAPGESKTYEYVFQLPKGLPPSHRGKVMKISYSLVIGTQRPGTAKEQRVNSIDFPFRVLGSVNGHGEILGHNLMSPYSPETSSNTATVRTVSEKELSRPWTLTPPGAQKQQQLPPQQLATRRRRSSTAATITGPTMNGFMMYVDELLKQREAESQADAASANGFFGAASAGSGDGNPRSGLLSPTAILPGSRRMSTASSIFLPDDNGRPLLSLSCREAIELAIMRSNLTDRNPYGGGGGSNVSANRFDISRNKLKVATVMLARPAYRLGETITMVVDFANAKIRCHAVHAALETIEKIVDPKLALRSEASVQRASRKVYASLSEATLYSRRFVFTATIPSNATPEFETTGVVLEWKIRVEFVVPAEDETDLHNHFANGNNDNEDYYERDDHEDDIQEEDDEDDDGEDDGSNAYGEEENDVTDDGSSSLSSRRPRRLLRQRSSHSAHNRQLRQNQNQNRATPPPPPMLEEISRDDRGGLVLAAVEALRCESFEAAVPIRVYGWSGDFGGSGEHDTREKVV